MSKGVVVSLCDVTGNMVRPWAEAGYQCICVDIQHSIRRDRQEGNILFTWGDVRSWWPSTFEDVVAVFAFPPCTHLAVSGARDFARKGLRHFIDALDLVESCRRMCEASGARWMIENPVGRLSTAWRKPDFSFNPCDYAGYLPKPSSDAYTKRTCLWTGGGFVMPDPRPVDPVLGSKMLRLGPSADRANLRSETPMGFARAVFEANGRDHSPYRQKS
jgi:hypothetical protein